jgi:hypothetical protein
MQPTGDYIPKACTPPLPQPSIQLPQPTTPPGAAHYRAGFKAGFHVGYHQGVAAGRLEAEGDALAVPSTPSDLSPPTPQPATPVWSAPPAIFIDAEGATHVSSEGVDVL